LGEKWQTIQHEEQRIIDNHKIEKISIQWLAELLHGIAVKQVKVSLVIKLIQQHQTSMLLLTKYEIYSI